MSGSVARQCLFRVLSFAGGRYTVPVTSRVSLALVVLTMLATASMVDAHTLVDHSGAAVAQRNGIDLAEPAGPANLPIAPLIVVAIAGALWTARMAALRARELRPVCVAAALLLVTTAAQAAPHLVHHVFDTDAGDSCKVKQLADLVGGLTIDFTLSAPIVTTLPRLVLSNPDPPSVFRPVDQSRAPPPAR